MITRRTSKPVFLGSNKQDLSFTEQQKMLLPDKKPWAFWAVSYVWYTFSFCQMFVWNMERKNLLIQERQLDLHALMLTQNLHHPSSSMPCIVLGYIIKQLIKHSSLMDMFPVSDVLCKCRSSSEKELQIRGLFLHMSTIRLHVWAASSSQNIEKRKERENMFLQI